MARPAHQIRCSGRPSRRSGTRDSPRADSGLPRDGEPSGGWTRRVPARPQLLLPPDRDRRWPVAHSLLPHLSRLSDAAATDEPFSTELAARSDYLLGDLPGGRIRRSGRTARSRDRVGAIRGRRRDAARRDGARRTLRRRDRGNVVHHRRPRVLRARRRPLAVAVDDAPDGGGRGAVVPQPWRPEGPSSSPCSVSCSQRVRSPARSACGRNSGAALVAGSRGAICDGPPPPARSW